MATVKLGTDGCFHHQYEEGNLCSFGITEVIVAGSLLEAAIGTTAATALTTAALGAAGGAAFSGLSGGNPLTGALYGGLSGGIGSLGGAAAGALGMDSTLGAGLAGAAGGAAGAGATGGNPLTAALMGGAGSALASGLSSMGTSTDVSTGIDGPDGISSPTDAGGAGEGAGSGALSAPSAGDVAPTTSLDPTLASVAQTGDSLGVSSGSAFPSDASSSLVSPSTAGQSPGILQQLKESIFGSDGGSGASGALSSGDNVSGASKPASTSATLGSSLKKMLNNPMALTMLANAAYNSANTPELPSLPQQQASTQGTMFNSKLPTYNFNSARAPISNYYTYGYSPQPQQITNTLTPTTPMAEGGRAKIKKFATGGLGHIHAPSIRIPHASARRSPGGGMAVLGAIAKMKSAMGGGNLPAAPAMGGAPMGGALPLAHGGSPRMHKTFMRDGHVAQHTGAKGQDDNVPAMLSEDEYVMPADVTSALGDGSPSAGGSVLDGFVKNVRAHKAVKGQPPKAKSPEQYLPKGRKSR